MPGIATRASRPHVAHGPQGYHIHSTADRVKGKRRDQLSLVQHMQEGQQGLGVIQVWFLAGSCH